jgi:hypothetical protein
MNTLTAVFDTSYKMSAFLATFSASHRLASKMRRLGGKLIMLPETFFVTARQGMLYDGEIERAIEWVKGILTRASS